MPFDFFNKQVPRGAIFRTKGDHFAVSDPPMGPPKDVRFSSLNKRASRNFQVFSAKRLFTPVKSNIVTTYFKIPGKHVRATVSGFGAVYVDVRKSHVTRMALYDRRGCRIARVNVPARKGGLSFAGVKVIGVKNAHGRIHRVKAPVAKVVMKLGDTPIVRHHKHGDIVVTDDFIYGEPQM